MSPAKRVSAIYSTLQRSRVTHCSASCQTTTHEAFKGGEMGHSRSSDSQADITRPTNANFMGEGWDHDDLSVSTDQRTLTARFPPALLASAPRLSASEGGSWRGNWNCQWLHGFLMSPRPPSPFHDIDTAPLSPPSLGALNPPMEPQKARLALASCGLESGGVWEPPQSECERSRSAEIKWEEKLRGKGRWRTRGILCSG